VGVGECVSARVCIVVCGHVFVCLVRSVYLDADDTILMAVEVCGDTLLSWSEGMLATPPFFYQMAGMAVGRDLLARSSIRRSPSPRRPDSG
jgi:hypothetical protein